MHFEYEERTICYYYWMFLSHLYLVINAFHVYQFNVVHLIGFLWFTNQLYHIICTPTHFMSIRHGGSKAQTQKRDGKFLHLDLWRKYTNKGDYIMISSEMNWIEEEASSSRAVVHPENCQKRIPATYTINIVTCKLVWNIVVPITQFIFSEQILS